MKGAVLYITFDGLTDPLGQSQVLPYLEGFARNGWKVHVLSCEKSERSGNIGVLRDRLESLGIAWKHLRYNTAGGAFTRIGYVRRLRRLAIAIARSEKIGIVHCRSYLASLVGLHLKRRFGIRFIFDMRGLWADERIDGGIWKRANPVHALFYRYFKNKERSFALGSDHIVSLTRKGLSEMERLYGPLKDKASVIPCCADLKLFDPEAARPVKVPGIEAGDHVLVYTGSAGTWYFIPEMIDCAFTWKREIPNLKLLIVTNDTAALLTILESADEDKRALVVHASARYEQIPSYLAIASAALFFIKPSYSKLASSPTKMAECWAMGLPIVTNRGIGDNDELFGENNGGVLVDGFHEAAYASAAREYLRNKRPPAHYRDIARRLFDREKGLAAYLSIYERAGGGRIA